MKNGFTLLEHILGRSNFAVPAGETARSAENSLNPPPLPPLSRLEIPLRPRLSSLRCRCRDFGSRLPACLPSGISQGERENKGVALAERICRGRLNPSPLCGRGAGVRGNNGFTLAEVLITLVIIGVIGALTVPALIQSTKKQELAAQLQKLYTSLSNVTQQIIAEEGAVKGWASNLDDVYNFYKARLSLLKDCGTASGCFKQFSRLKDLAGNRYNDISDTSAAKRKVILADGASVEFDMRSADCTNSGYGSNNVCIGIIADINGEKAPNQLGRDTFYFVLKETGLYPAGCDYARCEGTDGWSCTCKVLTEGAMNY